MRYGISVIITENEAAVATLREEAECFVLITNILRTYKREDDGEYDSRAALQAYKGRHDLSNTMNSFAYTLGHH